MALSEERFDRLMRQPAVVLFGSGILLLIFSAWLWWAKVFTGPRAVFDDMLSRNLSTSAVVARQLSRTQQGITVDKRSDIQFGGHNLVHIRATTSAAEPKAVVNTETVATPAEEFNRYTGLELGAGTANQNGTNGVLYKWAKGASANGTAYVQTLLRPYSFPMGDLSPANRSTLLRYLHDNEVFRTDYAVQRGSHDGRPTYTYNVRIQPVAYIAFLKGYARQLGLKELDEVDPASAQRSPPVAVKLTVDIRSRRMLRAEYPGLGFTEDYSDYNVARSADLPKSVISAEELQQRVSALR